MKVQRYALEGVPAAGAAEAREAPALMYSAMFVLAVVCIFGGVAMVQLREVLFDPAGEILLNGTKALLVGVAP